MYCLSIWGYCDCETDINYYNCENLSKKINSTLVNICFTCTLLLCMRYIFRHGQTLKTYDSFIKNTIDWLASYLWLSGGLKISLKSWICKDRLNGFSLFSACLLKWHTWNSELGRSSRLEPLSFSPTVRKCNTSGTGGQQTTRNLSSDDMGRDLQPHTLTLTNTTS